MDPYVDPQGKLLSQMAADIRAAKKVISTLVKALNGKKLLKKPLQTAVGDKFLSDGIKCDFDIYLTEHVPPSVKLSKEIGRSLRKNGFQPDGGAGAELPTAGRHPRVFGSATLLFKWSSGENGRGGRLRLVVSWIPPEKERKNWKQIANQLGKEGLLKVVQKL